MQCCTLGLFYCSSLTCDKRMSNESGDIVDDCLYLCLLMFVIEGYKGGARFVSVFLTLLPSPHHYLLINHHVPHLHFLSV